MKRKNLLCSFLLFVFFFTIIPQNLAAQETKGTLEKENTASAAKELPLEVPNFLASQTYFGLKTEKVRMLTREKQERLGQKQATYYFDLANFYQKYKEDDRRAMEFLMRALYFQPNFFHANLRLAQLFLLKGFYDTAYYYLLQAELSNPASDEVVITRKAIRMESDRVRRRVHKLQRMAHRFPKKSEEISRELKSLEKAFFNRGQAIYALDLRLPSEIYQNIDRNWLMDLEYHLETDKEKADRKAMERAERKKKHQIGMTEEQIRAEEEADK